MGPRRYKGRLPRQTVIPSQGSAPRVALVSGAIDKIALARNRLSGSSGQPNADPFVISQYDARPIDCIDFEKTFTAAEQTAAIGTTLAVFSFNVPDSRVAVVRHCSIVSYITQGAGVAPRNATTGAPQVGINANFTVNGEAVEAFNNVRVDDSVTAEVGSVALNNFVQGRFSVATYFLAPPSSVVALRLAITTAVHVFAFVQPLFGGQMLRAKQINPISEPGTHAPIPMAYGFNGGR